MGKIGRYRPSPALVISLIALFVAMGGIGYAAATIGTSDIKNNAVTAKKLHKKAVTRKKIKKNAVNGSKVQNDSLTGNDINESTLGLVPNANHANNADNATTAQNLAAAEAFHEVGATGEPPFQNGYSNFGSTFSTAGFMIDKEGFVHLKGTLNNGTNNTAAFTLPVGYRPAQDTFSAVGTTTGETADLEVRTSGAVEIHRSTGASTAGLDGQTFRAGG